MHADPAAVAAPFDRTVWVVGEGGLYECASLFCRRELFDRLGGFEDWLQARIGKPLGEDVWFGWRARRAGARTRFAEDALVHHAVFRRSAGAYVAERLRLIYFPAIVAKMPELRGAFYHRVFLSRGTAVVDVALAAGGAGIVLRSPLPLVGALPWGVMVARETRRWGRRAPRVAAVAAVADVVGFAALAIGSLRARTPLL